MINSNLASVMSGIPGLAEFCREHGHSERNTSVTRQGIIRVVVGHIV